MATTSEPVIRERNRLITADWVVKTDNEGFDGRERRHYACMTVSYSQGGVNYWQGTTNNPRCYRASIGRETGEDVVIDGRHLGESRGYFLFAAHGFKRSDPVARFSAKQLRAFFDEALAELERRRDEPEIAKYFDPDN